MARIVAEGSCKRFVVAERRRGMLGALAGVVHRRHRVVEARVPWAQRIEHVAHIGVVFGQRTQLWWDLPVAESFELLGEIYRVDRRDHQRRLDELVAALDVAAVLDVPVRQLSLGQRMRCDVLAALLHGFRRFFTWVIPLAFLSWVPGLVIMDRPERFGPEWLAWVSPAFGVLFLVVCLQLWRVGERHYRSTGS